MRSVYLLELDLLFKAIILMSPIAPPLVVITTLIHRFVLNKITIRRQRCPTIHRAPSMDRGLLDVICVVRSYLLTTVYYLYSFVVGWSRQFFASHFCAFTLCCYHIRCRCT